MLVKKPELRYQKVEEILADLKRIAKLGQPRVPAADVLSGLLEGAPPAAVPKGSGPAAARKPKRPDAAAIVPAKVKRDADAAKPRSTPRPALAKPSDPVKTVTVAEPAERKTNVMPYVIGGAIGLLVIAGAIMLIKQMIGSSEPGPKAEVSSSSPSRSIMPPTSSSAPST